MRSAERGKTCGDKVGMKLVNLFDSLAFIYGTGHEFGEFVCILAFVHEVVERIVQALSRTSEHLNKG